MFQILFVLKIMAVILTVPVTGTIDLTPIDNTDGEWVAPGYEVITELEFNPLEYVDTVQAAQAFFMDTDEGEKLRLILVGDNRVLVFDEPWETYREYPIESPWEVFSVTFSRNGRYLAIGLSKDTLINDGYFEREERVYQGIRIEITENDILSEYYDPRPGGVAYYYYLSDGGRITGSNERGVIALFPQGDIEEFLSRAPKSIMWQRRGCSYNETLIAIGNTVISDGSRGIQSYDWSGNLLWETPIGDRNLTGLRVSPSGEYVLAPARNGGVVCYSGEDGSRLWETAEGLLCDFPQISPTENIWVMAPDEIGHYYFYSGTLNDHYTLDQLSIYELQPGSMHPVCLNVNNLGCSLTWLSVPHSDLTRTLLLSPDQKPFYISETYDVGFNALSFKFTHAQSADYYFKSTISAISEDGSRISYTDYQTIKVLRFEEVE